MFGVRLKERPCRSRSRGGSGGRGRLESRHGRNLFFNIHVHHASCYRMEVGFLSAHRARYFSEPSLGDCQEETRTVRAIFKKGHFSCQNARFFDPFCCQTIV
jgi:hypothetical protein